MTRDERERMATEGSVAGDDRFRVLGFSPRFGKPLVVRPGVREPKWIGGDVVVVPAMEGAAVGNARDELRAQSSDFRTLPISLCGSSSRK